MRVVFLAVVIAFAVAAPTFAADAPKPTPGSSAPSKADKAKEPKKEEKLICTREADTGSLLAKRVCKTQEQIDAERRGAELMENDRQQLSNRVDGR